MLPTLKHLLPLSGKALLLCLIQTCYGILDQENYVYLIKSVVMIREILMNFSFICLHN